MYAILAMNRRLDSVRVAGAEIRRYNAAAPDRLDETALKWDGEWQITIEVFRDLGLAFAGRWCSSTCWSSGGSSRSGCRW